MSKPPAVAPHGNFPEHLLPAVGSTLSIRGSIIMVRPTRWSRRLGSVARAGAPPVAYRRWSAERVP